MKRIVIITISIILLSNFITNAQTRFSESIIVEGLSSPSGMYAGDIDQDGDEDILCASAELGVFVLRNLDGKGGDWGKSRIDNSMGATLTTWMADIDNDGFNDILTGGWDSGEVIWYRNTGNSSQWQKKLIQGSFPLPHEVMAEDVDGDGDLDVLCAGAQTNQIVIWFNQDGSGTTWQKQVVDNDFLGARSVGTADFDQDGDIDLAGASLNGNEITIWRNDGGTPIVWTEITLDNDFAGSHRVQLVDMNQDGLIDILGTAYGDKTIAWWKNTGTIANDWSKHVIEDELVGAVMGRAVDFDQDGDMDVVGTGQDGNTVNYYERTDVGENTWKRKILNDEFGGAWPLAVGDFNGDLNVDFAVGGNSVNEVIVYTNIQEGRFTRVMDLESGKVRAGMFIPPDLDEKLPLFLVLPYCGDEFAYSRLRDVMIALTEERPGVIMVPEIYNQGSSKSGLDDSTLLSNSISYAAKRFNVDEDSVFLIGMECNGSPVLDYGKINPDLFVGAIPFNPLNNNYVPGGYSEYPDLPVCVCSGTEHRDRLNHEAIVQDINLGYGKAWLNDLDGVGEEILVGSMIQKILDCIHFIDTVQGGTTSAQSQAIVFDFKVYPNPATSGISVHLSGFHQATKVAILDAYGRDVWSQKISAGDDLLRVDFQDQSFVSGFYFVKVESSAGYSAQRFIVQR